MTAQAFGLTLTVGAALLAFWILFRYTGFGPKSAAWGIAHVVVACLLLRSVPALVFDHIPASNASELPYFEIFGVALPLLVYAFLSGGWVTRIAVGHLRR
jgi:hypothetical protein